MSEPAAEHGDTFSATWPVLAFIFGAVCTVLASAGKFDALIQLSLLPVILIGFVTAIAWIVALLRNAYRHRWKRVLSALAAIPAALLAMPGLCSDFDLASEVRLVVNYADYSHQIAVLSAPAGERRIRWWWGGNTTAITGGELYSLVYDETVSEPTALCLDDPWPDADRPWCRPDRSQPKTWRLWGHFYLTEETVR